MKSTKQQPYICIFISMSDIKKFIWIDFIASTFIYYALKIPSHSLIAATAGSMVAPIIIRQSIIIRGRLKSYAA
ncbi:hypothetical protein [Paenibacillus gorillae]|uniref:hypothetical protein n=1 Tax=Paenibacillus gorillae TaxID=1243662 RepID=UPI0004AFB8E0|nr:hypothetical protein [Paenibacillus gorillae]